LEAAEMKLLRHTDGVLVVDSKDNELLRKVRKVQSNSECIMNYPAQAFTVDGNEVGKYRKEFKGRKVLAYVGNIFAAKGIYRYMELLARLKAEDPSVLLVVAGVVSFGEHQADMDLYLNKKGLQQHVRFFPWMSYSGLMSLLEHARVGLSLWDPNFFYFQRISVGNSRKTFTYLQAGVPVLVSLGAVGHFVERHGVGFYVDYRDDEAIYRAAKEILLNDGLFRQMSRRAKELVNTQCNWENELPKVEKVFVRALATRAR
jgi:glycosyltransferase involved in cell wall biosynthesis